MQTWWRNYPYLVIIMSFIISLSLAVMPLPPELRWCRPNWLLLVVIYWVMIMPQRISLGIAWLLGLLLDSLQGTLLGEHGLGLVVVAYVVVMVHQRLLMFPPWQQALFVGIATLCTQLLQLWVQGMIGQMHYSHIYWLSPVTTAIVWPIVFSLLKPSREDLPRYLDTLSS